MLGLAVLVLDDRQEFPAFRPVQADDPGALSEIHPQDPLAGLAMHPNHRVGHDRIIDTRLVERGPVVVGHVQTFESLFDVVREVLVRESGVDPHGVAPDVGQVDRPQDRPPGRHQPPAGVGVVGIPTLAVAQLAHLLVFLGVRGRDPMDGRDVVGLCLLPVRVGVERAELRREGGVLVLIELLAPEKHHLVLEDGRLDPVPDIVAQGMAQVDPADFRPDRGLQGLNRYAISPSRRRVQHRAHRVLQGQEKP